LSSRAAGPWYCAPNALGSYYWGLSTLPFGVPCIGLLLKPATSLTLQWGLERTHQVLQTCQACQVLACPATAALGSGLVHGCRLAILRCGVAEKCGMPAQTAYPACCCCPPAAEHGASNACCSRPCTSCSAVGLAALCQPGRCANRTQSAARNPGSIEAHSRFSSWACVLFLSTY
jgi:hypothetical protein